MPHSGESWLTPYMLFPQNHCSKLLQVINAFADGSALGLPKAYYQTKNIFSSLGLEEPLGWEPLLDQSEKHSLLLKTSLSDFLSHCGWISPPFNKQPGFPALNLQGPDSIISPGAVGRGASTHPRVSVLTAKRNKKQGEK